LKALVVAGGGLPQALLWDELARADIVVCADGGAAHLSAAGRLPHLLVGDMDSIEPGLLEELMSAGVETVRADAEKDETDAQLAVDEAMRRGASEIVLLGALGGRIDHALGNLMLLVRAAERGVRALIKDDACEIFAATGETEISGRAGETVSLLPAGSGVSVRYLDGFRYGTREPLPLPLDAPVGVSNVLTADRAYVFINGWAYIVRIVTS
jgi:thiamine pyrophosphokinase